MKACPTSNMHRSQLWGFEVTHIVASFAVLSITNVALNLSHSPLFLSWIAGLSTLLLLRFISHGQKNGHLEMLVRFTLEPHLFLGHAGRRKQKGVPQ